MTIGRWAALGASAALAVAATASPARAQADPARGTWQLYWENDSFLRGATTDESYTNGLRFAILGAEGGDIGPGWARGGLPRWWLSHIANANEANFILTSGYTFGQTFYTPEEINTTVLNPNDRPWAGWLYFGVLSQMTRQDFREEHLIELDVGVLGDPALAEEVQTAVHTMRRARIPKGWDNQIDAALALNAIYLYRRAVPVVPRIFDVVPHGGFTVGNVQVFANAGATARLGWNLKGFPSLLVPTTVEAPKEGSNWEVYVFAGIDSRRFAYNVFLDGNKSDSDVRYDVDRTDHVWDLRGGIAISCRRFRVDYSYVRRSEEFDPEPGGVEPVHEFGSIRISGEFR